MLTNRGGIKEIENNLVSLMADDSGGSVNRC